jgi:dihydrofolate reductase
MRKVIAAMNITLDGFCDHSVMAADDEIHEHYNDLLRNADTLVYGRITYELMKDYWPAVVKNPTGNKPTDDFAVIIENIPKVVFSHTLKEAGWKNATVAKLDLKKEVLELKQKAGREILVGSPGLIGALTNLHLIDEYQILVHPTIVGSGLPLFKNIKDRTNLKLLKTKVFNASGAVGLYYEVLTK